MLEPVALCMPASHFRDLDSPYARNPGSWFVNAKSQGWVAGAGLSVSEGSPGVSGFALQPRPPQDLALTEHQLHTAIERLKREFRVLSNLVRNARQAIMATGQPGEIGLLAAEDDQSWQLTITDTGPGLPQKAQEHLFQPFQGGVRKGGSGLGLVIAADLVRGHGGRLELQRTDDSGTTFTIKLPKEDLALAPAAE